MSTAVHGVLAVVAVLAAVVAAVAATPSRPPVPAAADRPPSSTVPEADAPPLFRMVASVAVAVGAWVLVGGLPGIGLGPVAGGVCWWAVGRMEPPAVRRRREAPCAR